MEYKSYPKNANCERPRTSPPRRVENLRNGGGRKDRPGWTEQKRKANRDRFNELRALIQTGVTIIYPEEATREQLMAFDACHRNYCKECNLPARSVWEGPGKHQHIALGARYDPVREERWKRRLNKRWRVLFGEPMPDKAFLWNPDVEPEKIASYCLKTRKERGAKVKGKWEWLTWNPVWETGFRWFLKASREAHPVLTIPRKKSVKQSPEKESHADSPHYTVASPEKERERENWARIAEICALSPEPPSGGTVTRLYSLARSLAYRMLSLRLDGGGLEIARQMHEVNELRLACAPPSGSILHMLIGDPATLSPELKIRLQTGTAIPRNFEVVYLSS